jgi:hypothetical protein
MMKAFRLAFILAQLFLILPLITAQNPKVSDNTRRKVLLARAEHGEALAQLELGRAYLSGRIVTPDDAAEALRWFLKAAEQHNSDALFELGSYYENGFYSPKDVTKAVRYYKLSAELGNTFAAVDLVHLYSEGTDGLSKDFDEAAHWAHCPKPSSATMADCKSIVHAELPEPALGLLRRLNCAWSPNYDEGAEIHLRTGSDASYYEVCCHDVRHGPCDAVVIGEVSGKWKNLTEVSGFEATCGGLIVLDATHAGMHDLCLSDRCSSVIAGRCDPVILKFSGTKYISTPSADLSKPH